MISTHLILGGARSGKSRYAQRLAEAACAERIFVATAEALDDEMAARIARHKADRGAGWSTLEAPIALVSAIGQSCDGRHAVLVDCLTLWLSNVMLGDFDVEIEIGRLVAAVELQQGPLILVSNEVGLGLVPDNALGREFRDAQGRLNRRIAEVSERVEFVAAGLPLKLKG